MSDTEPVRDENGDRAWTLEELMENEKELEEIGFVEGAKNNGKPILSVQQASKEERDLRDDAKVLLDQQDKEGARVALLKAEFLSHMRLITALFLTGDDNDLVKEGFEECISMVVALQKVEDRPPVEEVDEEVENTCEHEAVDNGCRKTWCRKCDADMHLNPEGIYVETRITCC